MQIEFDNMEKINNFNIKKILEVEDQCDLSNQCLIKIDENLENYDLKLEDYLGSIKINFD